MVSIMMQIFDNLSQVQYSELMDVYEESNILAGLENYPGEDKYTSRMLAEQDYYQYLSQVFFHISGSYLVVWMEQGRYISALRLEPYQDGLLIAGIETAPAYRRRGYARRLLTETVSCFTDQRHAILYAHIFKDNKASISLHETCGFCKFADKATFLDGTMSTQAYTYYFPIR